MHNTEGHSDEAGAFQDSDLGQLCSFHLLKKFLSKQYFSLAKRQLRVKLKSFMRVKL